MMTSITPIQQKQIDFQGGKITAVMVQDSDGRENVYIPLRPLVEGMGLNWSGQRKKIKKNPVLGEVCMSVGFRHSDIPKGSKQPKTSNVLAIPISHLNGYLFGINPNKVKPDLRPLIIEYQAKCYEVLFNAFNGTESMRRFYSAIGHDDGWIGARLEKHQYSTDLSDIWLISSVPIEHHERLQSLLNEGTFGLTTEEHKKHKSIPEDASLRDNMTRRELIFSMIADEAAIELSENENPTGLDDNTQIAKAAGQMTAQHVNLFEENTGGKVLSDKNHLDKRLGDGSK